MEKSAADLRQRIIETGRTLFLAQGFEGTTVQDLLDRLDIGEQVFLSFFGSLDELLEVVWSE
jgi:AcrR family transcriptional regulator